MATDGTSKHEKLNESFKELSDNIAELYDAYYEFAKKFISEVNTFGVEYVQPLLQQIEDIKAEYNRETESELESETNPEYGNINYEICMRCSKIYKSGTGYDEFYCSEECKKSNSNLNRVSDLDRWQNYERKR